jgi:hypothetical protein
MPMRLKGLEASNLSHEVTALVAVLGMVMGLTRDEVFAAAFQRAMRDHQHEAAKVIPADGDVTAIVMEGLFKLVADLEAAEKRS